MFNKSKWLPSYGRKRSRRLHLNQFSNNNHRILNVNENSDPINFFETKVKSVELEIGFGMGEHLIELAIKNPEIGFIGCETFENGVFKIEKEIEKLSLKNIKIFSQDARLLIENLKNASLSKIYILFPDPWPKRKHQKRRLINSEFVNEITRVLKGELRIATDNVSFLKYMLFKINSDVDLSSLLIKPENWPDTRYEQKAKIANRLCYYFSVSTC